MLLTTSLNVLVCRKGDKALKIIQKNKIKESSMNTKDAYKQKIEAELELIKAQLEVFKAKAKTMSADANLEFAKEINEFEDLYATLKSKLRDLGEASHSTWENLKEEIESAWDSLSASAKNTMNKLKD